MYLRVLIFNLIFRITFPIFLTLTENNRTSKISYF